MSVQAFTDEDLLREYKAWGSVVVRRTCPVCGGKIALSFNELFNEPYRFSVECKEFPYGDCLMVCAPSVGEAVVEWNKECAEFTAWEVWP